MKLKQITLWRIIAGASFVGLVSSLTQTIEVISYAKKPDAPLACDLNAIFSCSNVFDAWQSRVFGFSNSLICMIFFALTAGVALAAASGSAINQRLRQVFHFFSIFFLGFGAWYLWQSTYRIGFICIFCLFCYSAVIVMNWAWFRLQYGERYKTFIAKNWDSVLAMMWAAGIAAMIIFHFS